MGRIAAIDGKLQVMNDVGQEIPNVSTCFLTAFKTKDNLADKFILMGGKDACRRKLDASRLLELYGALRLF